MQKDKIEPVIRIYNYETKITVLSKYVMQHYEEVQQIC